MMYGRTEDSVRVPHVTFIIEYVFNPFGNVAMKIENTEGIRELLFDAIDLAHRVFVAVGRIH